MFDTKEIRCVWDTSSPPARRSPPAHEGFASQGLDRVRAGGGSVPRVARGSLPYQPQKPYRVATRGESGRNYWRRHASSDAGPRVPPFVITGVGRHNFELLHGLQRVGVEVTAATIPARRYDQLPGKVKVYREIGTNSDQEESGGSVPAIIRKSTAAFVSTVL